jgi:hypothetical protein
VGSRQHLVIWEDHRIYETEGSDEPKRLAGIPSTRKHSRISEIFSILSLAAYFSLLSMLKIGWSGLSFGTGISRLQPHEYSLQATEWVRNVSEVQSLISIIWSH